MWLWAALVSFSAVLMSLYPDARVVWPPWARLTLLTVVLTFLHARLHPQPRIWPVHEVGRDRVGAAPGFSAPRDFVLVFTSTQQSR